MGHRRLLQASLFLFALPAVIWHICSTMHFSNQRELAFGYPSLIREELERYRQRVGRYPPSLNDLLALDVPPLPDLLSPVGDYNGYYFGETNFFRFGMDWGFLGPLGSVYRSEEDKWEDYS